MIIMINMISILLVYSPNNSKFTREVFGMKEWKGVWEKKMV